MAKAKEEKTENVKAPETVKKPEETKKTSEKTYTLPQVMYIGPSIKGVISKNYIYLAGKPAEVIENIASKTGVSKGLIETLFVPVEELVTAKENLKNNSSKISLSYKKLTEKGR